MDKNTLKGLLVMGVVIFAFMLLNKPKPSQEQKNAQETTASTDRQTDTVLDSIRPTEVGVIYAADWIRQAGIADTSGETTVYNYNDGNVRLTLTDSVVSGTIAVDTLTVSYADLIPTVFLPE